MKHAFLIIAHNEFEILQVLIDCLDSEKTDIYVHIDKKVKVLPKLSVSKSKLFVLENRIDVRWGHTSQIESEYCLFEAAMNNGPYHHYHLLSGTHLPLRPINELLRFYESHANEEIIELWEELLGKDSNKLGRYCLVSKYFKHGSLRRQAIIQRIWTATIRIQKTLGIYQRPYETYLKGSNWVSLTDKAICHLITRKRYILRKYRYTLCPDEYFAPTELRNHNFSILNQKILYQIWGIDTPKVMDEDDLTPIMNSGCLYARKFSAINMRVVNSIYNKIHISK